MRPEYDRIDDHNGAAIGCRKPQLIKFSHDATHNLRVGERRTITNDCNMRHGAVSLDDEPDFDSTLKLRVTSQSGAVALLYLRIAAAHDRLDQRRGEPSRYRRGTRRRCTAHELP